MQYFKFDNDGNMYVYEPGSGFNGQCHFVSPGDELVFDRNLVKSNAKDDVSTSCKIESDSSSEIACDSLDSDGLSQMISRLINVIF